MARDAEMRMRDAERMHQRLDEAEAANMLISLGNSRSGTPQFSPTPLQGPISPHPGRSQSPMHLGYHSTGKYGCACMCAVLPASLQRPFIQATAAHVKILSHLVHMFCNQSKQYQMLNVLHGIKNSLIRKTVNQVLQATSNSLLNGSVHHT